MLQKRRLHVASSILKHKTPSIEVVSLWIQIPGAGCLECPRLCDDYGSIDTIQAGQCRSNRMDPKRWMKWFIRHYPTSHYKNHTFLTIKIIYYWAQNIHCVGRKGGKKHYKNKWVQRKMAVFRELLHQLICCPDTISKQFLTNNFATPHQQVNNNFPINTNFRVLKYPARHQFKKNNYAVQMFLSGREIQEGRDIHIPMANSCWCMGETNTIL